jgi:hypothetical protein
LLLDRGAPVDFDGGSDPLRHAVGEIKDWLLFRGAMGESSDPSRAEELRAKGREQKEAAASIASGCERKAAALQLQIVAGEWDPDSAPDLTLSARLTFWQPAAAHRDGAAPLHQHSTTLSPRSRRRRTSLSTTAAGGVNDGEHASGGDDEYPLSRIEVEEVNVPSTVLRWSPVGCYLPGVACLCPVERTAVPHIAGFDSVPMDDRFTDLYRCLLEHRIQIKGRESAQATIAAVAQGKRAAAAAREAANEAAVALDELIASVAVRQPHGAPPRTVLVIANSPGGAPLAEVQREAGGYATLGAADDSVSVVVETNITVARFRDALLEHRPEVLVFCGHGDAQLGDGLALAFVAGDGVTIDVVREETMSGIFDMLREAQAREGGRLQLLLLNGCSTLLLAKRLSKEVELPYIVCWSTRVADEAASVFGTECLRAVLSGQSVEDAFAAAKTSVEMISVGARLTGDHAHHAAQVPKFKLISPDNHALVNDLGTLRDGTATMAAGVPELVTSQIAVPEDWLVPHSQIRMTDTVLGRGSHGVVRLVHWNRQELASKELTIATHDSAQAKKVLLREARALAKVRHENIVRLWGVCIQPGSMCILMEYCSRGSVLKALHDDPELALWTRFGLARGAATAMLALHAHAPHAILHRDLKTANLLITKDWVCKVADFGLAKGVGTVSALTHAGCTPAYTAPEVQLDEEEFSAPADVYSFGVTLLEIASGEQPFAGLTPGQLIARLYREERPDIPAGCHPFFVDLVRACWAQDAAARPSFNIVLQRFDSAAAEFAAMEAAAEAAEAEQVAVAAAEAERIRKQAPQVDSPPLGSAIVVGSEGGGARAAVV